MTQLLVRARHLPLDTKGDEKPARVELRRQIGRLEQQLSRLFAEGFPRVAIETRVDAPPVSAPRALGLGELELVRDELAGRVADARLALLEREELETGNRDVLERMLERPEEFKWMRISRADVVEPGCGQWHSRPRFGLLGMLMGWWRVKISSGCPL
jgi:hypothetical protein